LRPRASVDEIRITRIWHDSALHLHKKIENFRGDVGTFKTRHGIGGVFASKTACRDFREKVISGSNLLIEDN
jgi:hypothetical protein